MGEIKINRNDETSRYELTVDGKLAAFAQFISASDVVIFPHTVTIPQFEGQGLASQLIQKAMDDMKAAGNKVLPTCPFVAHWLTKHPDYADLDYRK